MFMLGVQALDIQCFGHSMHAAVQAQQLLEEWIEDQVTKIDDKKYARILLPA